MEAQTVINIAIGISGVLMGAILRAVWEAVNDLQKSDKSIIKDVSELQVLVAGNYLKRDEFNTTMTVLFEKLEKIDGKLDKKANAAECPSRHGQ